MVSDEALKKLQEQIAAWPMTQRFVVQQLIEDYRMDREDLRAYKATGLTPQEVISIPAADVAPVVHAWWGTGRFNLETGNYEEQCTRCRNFSKEYDKPYCPNCGAKMDGGAE